MPKLTEQEEYQRLIQRKQEMEAALKEIDNRAGQLNKKLQDKKKIILGSIILKRMKTDKKLHDTVTKFLQSDLSEKDRILFTEELEGFNQSEHQDVTSPKNISDDFNSSQEHQLPDKVKTSTKKTKDAEPTL